MRLVRCLHLTGDQYQAARHRVVSKHKSLGDRGLDYVCESSAGLKGNFTPQQLRDIADAIDTLTELDMKNREAIRNICGFTIRKFAEPCPKTAAWKKPRRLNRDLCLECKYCDDIRDLGLVECTFGMEYWHKLARLFPGYMGAESLSRQEGI